MKYKLKMYLTICLVVSLSQMALAKPISGSQEKLLKAANSKKKKTSNKTKSSALTNAIKLIRRGDYEEATKRLFQLSHSAKYKDKRNRIKYMLGLMLYRMKFNQLSAYQFISVVKQGKSRYLRQSLEKLSLAADSLGDDTLLNYAINKVEASKFPSQHKSMLFYRIGEFQMQNRNYADAIRSFRRVNDNSEYYTRAKYMQGLAFAEENDTKNAVDTFNELIQSRAGEKVTDVSYVGALIGRARVLYQAKKWDASIEAYREIPRDSEFWHDTLFESSWASLRAGKFRQALSNFHSLHSAYYDNHYLPESLLLRAIVYLYICDFNEMEKVLNLFNSIYRPVYKNVRTIVSSKSPDFENLYETVMQVIEEYKKDGEEYKGGNKSIPLIVARKIYKEGDFQRSHKYIVKVFNEYKRMQSLSPAWKASALGRYAKKMLSLRLKKAKKTSGKIVMQHLKYISNELFDLFEQEGFVRFEMTKGKKRTVEKSSNEAETETGSEDSKRERDYYIQNGYEYWPFDGEYWLDELGNYHYVGSQSCQE